MGSPDDTLVQLRPAPGVSRRIFLKLLAGAGVGGLPGCFSAPAEKVHPYVRNPVGIIPGRAQHYATALCHDGLATGVVVTAYEGRPTKIEGNPEHPASLGAAGAWEQAALLGLYEPARARSMAEGGKPVGREHLLPSIRALAAEHARDQGEGLSLLLAPSTSQLQAEQLAQLRERFPRASLRCYAPLAPTGERQATQALLGRPLYARANLGQARTIISLDSDFLGTGPERLRLARELAGGRIPGEAMNRLYVAEAGLSLAGAVADHRLALRPSELYPVSLALLRSVAAERGVPLPGIQTPAPVQPEQQRWIDAAAREAVGNRGRAVVVAGAQQPAAVHAVALALNELLDAPITYSPPAEVEAPGGPEALSAWAEELTSGHVQTALVTAFDPVLSAPAGLDLAGALRRVPRLLQLASHSDATSSFAHAFIPLSHALESWGDARAADGTASIVQPLIAPLYDSLTSEELLSVWVDPVLRTAYDLSRAFWAPRVTGDLDVFWREALRHGVVAGSSFAPVEARISWAALPPLLPAPLAASGGWELDIREDLKVRAGEHVDNPWLQELPDPITKVTWENTIALGESSAKQLDVHDGDQVEVEHQGRRLQGHAVVVPGLAQGVATLTLGYGRPAAQLGEETVGYNGYPLRPASREPVTGATLRRTGEHRDLAMTQISTSQEARPLALFTDRAPQPAQTQQIEEHQQERATLYSPHPYPGYRWAMAIDLSRCIGCSACMVACQAENNVPVVGRDEVRRGREMHWIRIDRYYASSSAEPPVQFQPLACVHCEDAPCEYVCPVNATVHSDEGLNEMVYNRCVGTRYCSNNCPYKVRRFNWHAYDVLTGPEELGKNPEVTVRSRGVMEKCTYCVQRIEAARIHRDLEGQPIREGDIRTACQQACPTQAITFGTLSDPDSAVSRQHRDPRRYFLLDALGTRPRTAYLARVINPNPALKSP